MTMCECGIDISLIESKRPQIRVECLHDGTMGLTIHPDEGPIKFHAGDALEVKWLLDYPSDGAPPTIREIGRNDGDWEVQEDNRGGADAGINSDTRTISREDSSTYGALEGAGSSIVPDGFEPLIGYRAWVIQDNDTLRSTAHKDHTWKEEGPEQAKCLTFRDGHHVSYALYALRELVKQESDPLKRMDLEEELEKEIAHARRSPERNCKCGIYAVLNPSDISGRIGQMPNLVYGRVKAWGKIAEYSEGFRAEKVAIDCLYRPRGILNQLRVRRVAKKYGVKVEKAPIKFPAPLDEFPLTTVTFSAGLLVVTLIGAATSGAWGYISYGCAYTLGWFSWGWLLKKRK